MKDEADNKTKDWVGDMKFKNMKIEINEDQLLDDVLKELNRLGFNCEHHSDYPKSIETYFDGKFDMYCFRQESNTTLQQLLEMK